MPRTALAFDVRPAAPLSGEEIDAFVRRVVVILYRTPAAVDEFCARIEALLDRADTKHDEKIAR